MKSREKIDHLMRALDEDEAESLELGPCCICETRFGVSNIVLLNRRSPVSGHGWGCVICGLPPDGASVVLCDGCYELFQAGGTAIFACAGYPQTDGRVPFADLPQGEFDHDPTKHEWKIER